MKIAILVNDGSSLGVTEKTIWGDVHRVGCGGSELALITLCEGWVDRGYDIVLYNDPKEAGASRFEQRPKDSFDTSEYHDVVIAFRTPNPKIIVANTPLKVWLSFDQFTSQPFSNFAPHVDKIIGISKTQKEYFSDVYNINNLQVIDLPLRVQDFDFSIEKVQNRLIFTSVPDRGLMNLHAMWPSIKKEVPDASLVITSDYRLWGSASPLNQPFYQHFLPFMATGAVQFLGALPRVDYLKELMKAELFVYPHKGQSDIHELFCISAMEAQYANAYPITSRYGALDTTNMGCKIDGDPTSPEFSTRFIDAVVEYLSDKVKLVTERSKVSSAILERCHIDTIMNKWDEEVFGL